MRMGKGKSISSTYSLNLQSSTVALRMIANVEDGQDARQGHFEGPRLVRSLFGDEDLLWSCESVYCQPLHLRVLHLGAMGIRREDILD